MELFYSFISSNTLGLTEKNTDWEGVFFGNSFFTIGLLFKLNQLEDISNNLYYLFYLFFPPMGRAANRLSFFLTAGTTRVQLGTNTLK